MSELTMNDALESLRQKFTSGNDVPVTEARITRAEYEALQATEAVELTDDSNRRNHKPVFRRCDCCGHISFQSEDIIFVRAILDAAISTEKNRCLEIIEKYQIPVGNSAAGEMAAEWTIDALKSIRKEITYKDSENDNV